MMNVSRLTWQLPALILLSIPLWQGPVTRFLTLEHGMNTAPLHQDSSFLLEEVLFTQSNRGDSVQSPLVSDGDSVQSPLQSDGDSVQSPLVSDGDSVQSPLVSDGDGDSVQSPPEDGLTLSAKRVHGSDQGSGFDLEGVDLRRRGANPLHITGGHASFDPERQILTLLDAVVVETADLVVRTPVMRYLAKYETLKSAAEVEITGKEMTLAGVSFMYNLQSGDLRVGERVRFHYAPLPPAGE